MEGMEEVEKFNKVDVFNDVYHDDIEKRINIINKVTKLVSTIIVDKKIKYFVTGPVIKSLFIEVDTKISKIKKELSVFILGNNSNIKKGINKDKVIDGGSAYVSAINDYKIVIYKYSFNSIPQYLFGLDNLERVCMYDGSIYISTMFALDFYKAYSISNADEFNDEYGGEKSIDPILKLPKDILNIYNRHSVSDNLVKMVIDSININKMSSLTQEIVDKNIYCDFSRKPVTAIEYALYTHYKEDNPMFKFNLRLIVTRLNEFKYIRDPMYMAMALKLNETDSELMNILSVNKYKYTPASPLNEDLENMDATMHHINMDIIHKMIENDDSNLLVFLENIDYSKRALNDINSKTGSQIINSIVKNKSKNIIDKFIKSDNVIDYYKLYVVLMTEELDLLEELDIDNINDLLINYLEDIIDRGLLMSLYYLIKKDRDSIFDYKSSKNNNILHMIKDSGRYFDIVKLIMRINDDLINEQNDDGETPLHIFALNGYSDLIDLVLGYEATDYTICDGEGNTFLHILCSYNHTESVKNCIRRVIPIINEKNDNGETAVMISAKKGNEDTLYMLKGVNANMNIKDNHGNTPYHYVCLKSICCSMIIPSIKNNYGYTPRDYCRLDEMYYNFV
jgi:hypothetical protein